MEMLQRRRSDKSWQQFCPKRYVVAWTSSVPPTPSLPSEIELVEFVGITSLLIHVLHLTSDYIIFDFRFPLMSRKSANDHQWPLPFLPFCRILSSTKLKVEADILYVHLNSSAVKDATRFSHTILVLLRECAKSRLAFCQWLF